ncbi:MULTISPECIES: hypothetical protein [Archaeoglobus]|nr:MULTISPECIES: hypothetical protein [Archaeoglobus]
MSEFGFAPNKATVWGRETAASPFGITLGRKLLVAAAQGFYGGGGKSLVL